MALQVYKKLLFFVFLLTFFGLSTQSADLFDPSDYGRVLSSPIPNDMKQEYNAFTGSTSGSFRGICHAVEYVHHLYEMLENAVENVKKTSFDFEQKEKEGFRDETETALGHYRTAQKNLLNLAARVELALRGAHCGGISSRPATADEARIMIGAAVGIGRAIANLKTRNDKTSQIGHFNFLTTEHTVSDTTYVTQQTHVNIVNGLIQKTAIDILKQQLDRSDVVRLSPDKIIKCDGSDDHEIPDSLPYAGLPAIDLERFTNNLDLWAHHLLDLSNPNSLGSSRWTVDDQLLHRMVDISKFGAPLKGVHVRCNGVTDAGVQELLPLLGDDLQDFTLENASMHFAIFKSLRSKLFGARLTTLSLSDCTITGCPTGGDGVASEGPISSDEENAWENMVSINLSHMQFDNEQFLGQFYKRAALKANKANRVGKLADVRTTNLLTYSK